MLIWEARLILRKHQPSIVGVTGSVGKTSTKDAIYAALCESVRVRKSDRSFNTEFGVLFAILGRPFPHKNPLRWVQALFDGLVVGLLSTVYPDWLVLEIGADRPGDIRSVARWLPIDIAVITRLPEVPVHVEFFETPEELLEEKASIISALKPSGSLFLYADDDRVRALKDRAEGRRVLTFGFLHTATVYADMPQFILDELGRAVGMRAVIYAENSSAPCEIHGAVGLPVFVPVLAAAAIGISQNMTLPEVIAAIERNYVPPPSRMRLVAGMRESTILDDSYNSSPAAAQAALETLRAMPIQGNKYAVLGDMMELGRFSVEEHRKIGALAATACDVLITVGIRARNIANAALDGGMPDANILQFENPEEAGAYLARSLGKGDIALIKGSRVMQLEKVVALAKNV